MHDATSAHPSTPAVVDHPPALSWADLWPGALFGTVVLTVLLYIVGVEGSAASLGGGTFIHELMHDGRHVLGFPCH